MAAHSPSTSIITPVLNSKATVGFAVRCGRLIPPWDEKALGQAITTLLRDDRLRLAMGKRCRQRTVGQYDGQRFSDSHLTQYKELGEKAQGGKQGPVAVSEPANQSFDIVVCFNVLDHSAAPTIVAREVHRLL